MTTKQMRENARKGNHNTYKLRFALMSDVFSENDRQMSLAASSLPPLPARQEDGDADDVEQMASWADNPHQWLIWEEIKNPPPASEPRENIRMIIMRGHKLHVGVDILSHICRTFRNLLVLVTGSYNYLGYGQDENTDNNVVDEMVSGLPHLRHLSIGQHNGIGIAEARAPLHKKW